MKALVLGCNGQLGEALAASLPDGVEYLGRDLPELDITDADGVLALCRDLQPGVIINAAAFTAVDRAEEEAELAAAVNEEGPRHVASAARQVGARLIHVSTDFVFDGKSRKPYAPDAATNPLSVYGRTKRDGEQAVLEGQPDNSVVVRTAWLYSKTGGNFVKTMLRLMQEREELSVVADQVGTPTWANSLAEAVWGFTAAPTANGIFHWTDGGEASWHDFATAIQDEALALGILDRAIPIHGITTAQYPTPATRPRYSVMDCSASHAALGLQASPWRDNLRRMLKGMMS